MTVGPGDDVRDTLNARDSEVIAQYGGVIVLYCCHDSLFYPAHAHNLRTPDGKPVSGFAERECFCHHLFDIAMERAKRIAELERERKSLWNKACELESTIRLETKAGRVETWKQALRRIVSERDTASHNAVHYAEMSERMERERDEARAERDRVADALSRKAGYNIMSGEWVRLDDETIERVADEWRKVNSNGQDVVTRMFNAPGDVRAVLRDLRDGKLRKDGE